MSGWHVGAAWVDITPPLTVPELGFVPRQHRFKGIHDPLRAKSVAVTTDEGAAILVAVDAIGFHWGLLGANRDFIAEFRRRVKETTGVEEDAIMLCASHAHSTPETIGLTPLREIPEAAAWVETWLTQLVDCAVLAWRDLKEAKVYASVGEVKGVAWSRRIIGKDGKAYRLPRRPPDEQVLREWHDPRLGVVRFARSDGDIVLINFTCHPTVVQVNDLVSADFPGALARFIEEKSLGCRICLFTQGACGDVNPIYQTTGDFDDVALYGMALAGEVIKQVALLRLHFKGDGQRERIAETFRGIGGWEAIALTPSVRFARDCFLAPPRPDLPDPEGAEKAFQEALGKVNGAMSWMRSDRPLTDEERKIGQEIREAWQRWQTALRGRDERERTVEVQVVALGELAFVGVSGELFVAPGLRIKALSPFPLTFIVGYANGYNGYLTTKGAWSEGGYEVQLGQWTLCGEGSGDLVADLALRLLYRVHGR